MFRSGGGGGGRGGRGAERRAGRRALPSHPVGGREGRGRCAPRATRDRGLPAGGGPAPPGLTAAEREPAAARRTTRGPSVYPRAARLLPRAEALVHQRLREGPVPPAREGGPTGAAAARPHPATLAAALDDRVVGEAIAAAPSGPHAPSLRRPRARRHLPRRAGAARVASSGRSVDAASTVRPRDGTDGTGGTTSRAATPSGAAARHGSRRGLGPGPGPRRAQHGGRRLSCTGGDALRRPEPGRGTRTEEDRRGTARRRGGRFVSRAG